MCIYRDHPYEENFPLSPQMTSDFKALYKSWSLVVLLQRQSIGSEDKQKHFGSWKHWVGG